MVEAKQLLPDREYPFEQPPGRSVIAEVPDVNRQVVERCRDGWMGGAESLLANGERALVQRARRRVVASLTAKVRQVVD